MIAHLGYDREGALARLGREAKTAGTPRIVRPPIDYVRVYRYELPAFVLDRARDKGIDIA